MRYIDEDPNAYIVIFMKKETYDIVWRILPIARIRSRFVIILLHIPMCGPYIMSRYCLHKNNTSGNKLCKIQTAQGLSVWPESESMVTAETDYQHIYCEYDDIVMSMVGVALKQSRDHVGEIVSRDINVDKVKNGEIGRFMMSVEMQVTIVNVDT